eukprot:GILJ01007148.1.p1 GENE.GILJ01007148.1~~GILJ01007148.1.p1  ORF type:complete len:303 (+),score=40.60 GILJ01007148.1:340-1248(+)
MSLRVTPFVALVWLGVLGAVALAAPTKMVEISYYSDDKCTSTPVVNRYPLNSCFSQNVLISGASLLGLTTTLWGKAVSCNSTRIVAQGWLSKGEQQCEAGTGGSDLSRIPGRCYKEQASPKDVKTMTYNCITAYPPLGQKCRGYLTCLKDYTSCLQTNNVDVSGCAAIDSCKAFGADQDGDVTFVGANIKKCLSNANVAGCLNNATTTALGAVSCLGNVTSCATTNPISGVSCSSTNTSPCLAAVNSYLTCGSDLLKQAVQDVVQAASKSSAARPLIGDSPLFFLFAVTFSVAGYVRMFFDL